MRLTYIRWSMTIIETQGLTIITDPVFRMLGTHQTPKAYTYERMPRPDLVFISHTHFDYYSPSVLRRLPDGTPVYMPSEKVHRAARLGLGALRGLEAWESDAAARRCLALVAGLPREVARQSTGYLALFRSNGGRGLSWKKAERLLGELRDLVAAGHIQWHRKPARQVKPAIWGRAMEKMVTIPPRELPLDGHGYLRKVVYRLADEADREGERRRVEAERAGRAHNYLPNRR